MATVFLARDEKHGRRVAVKVLRPDLAASLGAKRFLWEIGIAAQLQHPHILGLIDSGEAGRRYMVHKKISPGIDIHALVRNDVALEQWVREKAYGGWHASGTCRMGADGDPMAVLDSSCRVRGVENLRVVDASAMPSIPAANTNITTIMMAEKVAASIRAGD